MGESDQAGEEETHHFAEHFDRLVRNIERNIVGKADVIRLALVCMLSEGHLLIEDVPGVGKTSLAKSIAESIDGKLSRIQFTPDLLPSDVTGVQIYNTTTAKFEFHPGSVFANVVLGDEINRASPKTQSALLEVMEEHHVTVDGVPHHVPEPFIVIATQNPIEHDGTYNLPEAQLDRFMMRIGIGYPGPNAELEIIGQIESHSHRRELSPVIDTRRMAELIGIAQRVFLSRNVREYIVSLVGATRQLGQLALGVSPRGGIALARAARTLAAAEARPFVTPDDVKILVPSVLSHRMLLSPEAELQGSDVDRLVQQVLDAVPVPRQRGDA